MTQEKPSLLLSEEEIAEIEKRANAATPGPWYTQATGETYAGFSVESLICATAPGKYNRVYANPPGGSFPGADQSFIANARQDIPRLIATIRAYEAKIRMLTQQRDLLRAHVYAGMPPGTLCNGDDLNLETLTYEGPYQCMDCGKVDPPKAKVIQDESGKVIGFKCLPTCEATTQGGR